MSVLKLAVCFVGAVLLICVAGVVWLAGHHEGIPDELKVLSVSALTGLLGLMVPARPGQA